MQMEDLVYQWWGSQTITPTYAADVPYRSRVSPGVMQVLGEGRRRVICAVHAGLNRDVRAPDRLSAGWRSGPEQWAELFARARSALRVMAIVSDILRREAQTPGALDGLLARMADRLDHEITAVCPLIHPDGTIEQSPDPRDVRDTPRGGFPPLPPEPTKRERSICRHEAKRPGDGTGG